MCFLSYLITCEIDVWDIDALLVLLALCAITHYHPAAVGTCVGSRGRHQDQLTVLVTVFDAAGGKQTCKTFTHSHHLTASLLMCASKHLRRESLKVSRFVGYDHPIELPLQRSSMFFPGVTVVLWPRRTKRPLSNTWVNRDWPFPPPSFILGCLIFTRFPPGLMRFSPASFLRFTCWQAPKYTKAERKEGELESRE